MKKTLLLLGPALTLAACAPAVVRASDAQLAATAQSPYGTYQFNCNPVLDANRSGVTLTLQDDNTLTCRSSDGQATLALILVGPKTNAAQNVRVDVAPVGQPPVYRSVMVKPEDSPARTYVLLVLPGLNGAPPLSFIGTADLQNKTAYNLFRQAGSRGQFSANLGSGVTINGSYNLVGQR